MANTLRIKRRAAGGAAGAPASMANAELAFNEQDNILYYGWGTGGAGGTATQALAIGGPGAFQAVDADLTAIAALSTTGIAVRTAANTWALRTLTAPAAGITISNGDGVSGNPTLALANDLAALEGLSTTGLITRTADGAATTRSIAGAAGNITVSNGSGVAGNPTIDLAAVGVYAGVTLSTTHVLTDVVVDAYGRVYSYTNINLSDISLNQFKVPQDNLSINSKRLTNLADPVNAQDAATKAYVDAARSGLNVKASCRAATTANVDLSTTLTSLTIDTIQLAVGDRVLVKNQTNGAQNGIYVVSNLSGSGPNWVRASDFDTDAEVPPGAFTFIAEGFVNADSGWVLTTDSPTAPTPLPIIVGVSQLTFAQFSGAGQITAGAGLTKTGNTLDVVTASAARIVVNADSIDLATAGTAGTYKSVTTDAYGRVTSGTNPTTLAGFGITDAQPLDATLTALAGMAWSAGTQVVTLTAADTISLKTVGSAAGNILDKAAGDALYQPLATRLTNLVGVSWSSGIVIPTLTSATAVTGKAVAAWAIDTFMTSADAAIARSALGCLSMSTQASTNVNITGGSIDGITFDGGTF